MADKYSVDEEESSTESSVGSTTVFTTNDSLKSQMSKSWYGKPVEEVDPLIFEETFCVITEKMGRHLIHRLSCSKSLFLMGPLNPIRKLAIYITTHRWFDIAIILTILCNCVTLAMTTNMYVEELPRMRMVPVYDRYIDWIEYGFLAVYTTEVVLKVIAKGLVFNKLSYLRNRWNILDLIVVTSAFVTTIEELLAEESEGGDNENENSLKFLRTFRVLRAAKTISIFPGLKMMINALVSSIVHLMDVMLLIFVALIIFSIFSLEVFQGKLSQKCVVDKGGPHDEDRLVNVPLETVTDSDERDQLWTEWVTDWKHWERRDFPQDEPTQCGNDTYARHCSDGYTCIGRLGENPDDGWTGFDTFFGYMLYTFQLVTSDYWERVYDVVVSTSGVWSLVFFIIIIFLGYYCLLNLLLAVVTMSYENEAQHIDQGEKTPFQRLNLNHAASTFSFDELSKLNICKMTSYRKRTKSEKEILEKKIQSEKRSETTFHMDDAILNLLGKKLHPFEKERTSVSKPKLSFKNQEQEEVLGERTTAFVNNEEQSQSTAADGSDVEVDMSKLSTSKSTIVALQGRVSMFLKKHLVAIVNHRCFEIAITICIIINTICLAMEHHGASKIQDEVLKLANHIFMAVFTAECILKILALQSEYLRHGWNIFDMVIVIISYFDLAVASANTGSRGLSVIRSMRLLRVFKLAHSWITMKVLLNIIFASFGDLGNLTCLLMIVIYIFAVMGMQIVGDLYYPAAFGASISHLTFPPWNWGHFWYAFMMVFRVLCGEWIEPMWDCLKAQEFHINIMNNNGADLDSSEYVKCFAIYLSILIVGNFIVFNLFLALLLNSFDTEELNAQRQKELEASGRAENLKNIVNFMMTQRPEEEDDETETETDQETDEDKTGNDYATYAKDRRKSRAMSKRYSHISTARARWKWAIKRVILHIKIEEAERAIARAEYKINRKNLTNKYFLRNPGQRSNSEAFDREVTPESSGVSEQIFVARDCFPPKIWMSRFCPCRTGLIPKRKNVVQISVWDKIRGWSVAIVGHPIFEYAILALIFASSIALSFEDVYLNEKPQLKYILCTLNVVFTGIFLVEMILKWLAIGVWSYFTNFWTLLDGFIVGVSLISFFFDFTEDFCSGTEGKRSGNLGALKALRTLRALRPLRAISRWQSMKIVVNSLVHAVPAIFNVMLVCLLFWLVFSIMGVQFFKGQFYRCVSENGKFIDPRIIPNKDVCCAKAESHDYSWTNTISNYDNVFEGYLSLFQIATFEGWMELMEYSVNAVGVDKQPIRNYQIEYYAFYVIFIIFGAFFALQLFIGVIIDNFNMLKKKYDGSTLEILLTPTQRNYYIAMKNLGKKMPRPVERPKSKFRSFFYYLALSRKLEIIIFIMIFLNMGVEAFNDTGTGMLLEHSLIACKAFFTTVYVLEALIKIIGLGPFYFTIPWNVYDFIIVLASLMDIFLTSDLSLTVPIPPAMLRIIRVFRIGRVLRTVKAAKGLRKLLFALTVSFPALCNIGALLTLITFIYAILGMALFSHAPVKWSIDQVFSFRTFLSSNLMLLRLMTAAGWNEVLDSLTVIEPECGSVRHINCGIGVEPECISRALVITYIISYSLLTNQIMINLFIAIILENYVEASEEEDVGIVGDDLEMFYVRWSKYDPYATQFISFGDLSDFLDRLNPPLRLPKPNIMTIIAFNLPIARGCKIHCLDVLHALIKHVLGEVDDTPEFRKVQNGMERKFQDLFPNRRLLEIVSCTRRWKLENNAASIIQRAWRKYWAIVKPTREQQRLSKELEAQAKRESQSSKSEQHHGGFGNMMNRMIHHKKHKKNKGAKESMFQRKKKKPNKKGKR